MFTSLLLTALLAAPSYHWQVIPIDGGGSIECLAVSPHHPAVMLAGCDVGGVHRSFDSGHTWVPVNTGLVSDADLAVADIAFHPTDPDLVYLATGKCFGRPSGDYGGLFVSEDGGLSWQLRSREVKFAGHADQRQRGKVLLVDPFVPDRIWAATAWDGVMISDDQGRTWRRLGPTDHFLTALGRTVDGTLYVGSIPHVGCAGGLYTISLQNPQWTQLTDRPVRDLAVASSEPGRVLLTTPNEGLLLSEDFGRTWVNVSPAGFCDRLRADSVAFSPSHPRVAVATGVEKHWQTRHPDVYLSLDHGRTWQPMVTKPAEQVSLVPWWAGVDRFGFNPHCVAFDPHTARRVWIGDWYAVWGTTDGAASWFGGPRGLRTTVTRQLALDPDDPNHAYLGMADIGVFRVDAAPLAAVALGANSTGISSVRGLTCRRGPNGVTVVVSHGQGVWLQDQLGHWTAGEGQAPAELGRLLTLRGGALVAECDGQPLQLSRDAGRSWSAWGTPAIPGLRLPVWLDEAQRVGMAWHPERGFHLTRDGGSTWGAVTTDLPDLTFGGRQHKFLRALAAQPGRQPVLYAANRAAVWRSLDEGRTFERVFAQSVYDLTVDPSTGRVYACATGYWYDSFQPGLYVSDDRGETWSKVAIDLPVGQLFGTIQVDPRNGRVWLGSQGNVGLIGDPQ